MCVSVQVSVYDFESSFLIMFITFVSTVIHQNYLVFYVTFICIVMFAHTLENNNDVLVF